MSRVNGVWLLRSCWSLTCCRGIQSRRSDHARLAPELLILLISTHLTPTFRHEAQLHIKVCSFALYSKSVLISPKGLTIMTVLFSSRICECNSLSKREKCPKSFATAESCVLISRGSLSRLRKTLCGLFNQAVALTCAPLLAYRDLSGPHAHISTLQLVL